MERKIDKKLIEWKDNPNRQLELETKKLIGEGATAKVYRNGHMATKVYPKEWVGKVKNEMKQQKLAYDSGLAVPNVYAVRKLDDGRIAFDMEYIDGSPLMHHHMDEVETAASINILVELQCEMHKIHAPELPKLTDVMTQKILSTNLKIEIKNELLTLLSQPNDRLEQLCHGDFHPLNILDDGRKYIIIDWVDAAAGNPFADICRTYLLMRPQLEALAALYLQMICRKMGYQLCHVLNWQPVVAAARLSERIDDSSREYLLDLVEAWYEGLR